MPKTNHSRQTEIAIFGSYTDNSIGDKAILIGLIDILFKNSSLPLHIKILSFHKHSIEVEIKDYNWARHTEVISLKPTENHTPEMGKKMHNYTQLILSLLPKMIQTLVGMTLFSTKLRKIFPKKSNGLIIGGGNLLMDMFPMWPGRPYLLAKQYHNANLPVIIAGVGAFPIQTPLSKFLFKNLIQKANLVFVRDHETKKYIQQTWRSQVQYHPDFALSFPLPKMPPQHTRKSTVAVNIAPIFSKVWPYKNPQKYQYILNVLAKSLYKYFVSSQGTISYYFYDTNYPTDRIATLELINRLVTLGISPKKIQYEDRLHSSRETIQKLRGIRFAVVTRLHAGIIAIRTGTPIIAIAYQPKVKTVLKAIGIKTDAIIDIDNIEEIDMSLKKIDSNPYHFMLSPKQLKNLDETNKRVIKKVLDCIIKNNRETKKR